MNGGHNSHHKMEKTKLKSLESDVKTDETFKENEKKKVTQPSQWSREVKRKRRRKVEEESNIKKK